jgi:hypothetical protein
MNVARSAPSPWYRCPETYRRAEPAGGHVDDQVDDEEPEAEDEVLQRHALPLIAPVIAPTVASSHGR